MYKPNILSIAFIVLLAEALFWYTAANQYLGLLLSGLLGGSLLALVYKKFRLVFTGLLTATVLLISVHTHYSYEASRLPASIYAQPVELIGLIKELQINSHTQQQSLVVEVEQINGKLNNPLSLIRLSCQNECPHVSIGEQWQLLARLKSMQSLVNPAGFDAERYAYLQKLIARGQLIHSKRNRQIENRLVEAAPESIEQLRINLSAKVRERYLGEGQAFLLPIALGEKSLLKPFQKEWLRQLGLSHLFVVSGLHVALIGGIAWFVLGWLWQVISLGLTQRSLQTIGTTIFTLSYVLITGSEIPTVRAFIMLQIFLWLPMIGIASNLWDRFGVALIIVLLNEPLAVLRTNFWLSFYATAIILSYTNQRESKCSFGYFRELLYLQGYLLVALIPIQLFTFGLMNPLSIIWNLIWIPLMGFILLPWSLFELLVSGFAVPGYTSSQYDQFSLFLWTYIEHMALLSQNMLIQWSLTLTLSLLLCFVLFSYRFLPTSTSRLLYLSIITIISLTSTFKPDFRIIFFDVGQGTAIAIESQGKVMIFDTGFSIEEYQVAERVLIPWLDSRHYKNIDELIISHADNDHSGGMSGLLDRFEVGRLWTNGFQPKGFKCQKAVGETQTLGILNWSFIWPNSNSSQLNDNNRSCVLMLSYMDYRFLLTGDIEEQAEKEIITQNNDLKVDVLLAPHHGSQTSSSHGFLRQTAPDLAIVTSGYLNRYRLPHDVIIERYRRYGIKLLNTAESGAIEITIDRAGKLAIREFRLDNHELWRIKPD